MYVRDAIWLILALLMATSHLFFASLFRGLQLLDLLDEVSLLIVELLVFGAVSVELGEEVHELVLVAQQYVQYRLRFVRIRDEDLEMGICMLSFVT